MANKKGVGSSAFTHLDDQGADLHTSDPRHHEAMFYGGSVPPKTELQEVVLGPPAFGSPDPRTLGHVMQPAIDVPASAPELSEDYPQTVNNGEDNQEKGNEQDGAPAEESSEGESEDEGLTTNYKSHTKAELLEEAEKRGVDVDESNTKDEIVSALEDDDSAQ